MGLGSAMAGGNPAAGRNADDFYPTEKEATIGLLNAELFDPLIHECACGRGDMAQVMRIAGYDVVATDIAPRGYGTVRDFLKIPSPLAPSIVTNPPFELAADFIEHGMGALGAAKMALLLKSTYWHAKNRTALFAKYPPVRIHALTWRLDFNGKGRPTMECSWFVWERGFTGDPVYRLMPRPTALIPRAIRAARAIV